MLSAITSPLAIALLALTQGTAQPFVAETDDGFRITTVASEKYYQSYLTRDAIRKTPAWDQEKDDSPPVSPRKAIRLAEKMRKSVVKADNREWEVANMHLIFEGTHCAWYVTLRTALTEAELEGGLSNEVTLFVLMDGTVIKPKVKGLDERD